MCTNDLYLCKDSSRINCTLACSTLGYIPCRNYVDKKICSTVNKKSNLGGGGSRFFGLRPSGASSSGGSGGGSTFGFLFNNDDDFSAGEHSLFLRLGGDTLVFSLLGVILFATLIGVLVLFGVLYNRNKKRRKKSPSSSSMGRSSEGFLPGELDDDVTCGSGGRHITASLAGHMSRNNGFMTASMTSLASRTIFDDAAKNYSSLCRNLRLRDDLDSRQIPPPPLPLQHPHSHSTLKSDRSFVVSFFKFIFVNI